MHYAHSFLLKTYFPKEIAARCTGVVAGVLADRGRLKPAREGLSLSGRWRYGSASVHSSWFLMGARDGDNVHRLALIPTSAVDIHHDWEGPGLLGTASHNVSVNGALVAKDWSIDLAAFRASKSTALLSWALVGTGLGIADMLGLDAATYSVVIEKDIHDSAEPAVQKRHMAEAIQALAAQTKNPDMTTLATHMAFRL